MNKDIIGERIKKRREKLNMTQRELAEKMDGRKYEKDEPTGKSKVCNWEHGRGLKLSTLDKLCEILDCDAAYLLGEQDYARREIADIATQIPLDEDAIKALISLKKMCESNKKEGVNPPCYEIEAALLSKLIYNFHYQKMIDEAHHRKWDIHRLVHEIWDMEYVSISPDYIKAAARDSISRAFGAVVYDGIKGDKERAEAYFEATNQLHKID